MVSFDNFIKQICTSVKKIMGTMTGTNDELEIEPVYVIEEQHIWRQKHLLKLGWSSNVTTNLVSAPNAEV